MHIVHHKYFRNESEAYRRVQNHLVDAEIVLQRSTEKVAALSYLK